MAVLRLLFSISIWICLIPSCIGIDTLTINSKFKQEHYLWSENYLELLKVDHQSKDSLHEVLQYHQLNHFQPNKGTDFWIQNPDIDHWGHVVIKSTVKNNNQWFIELYDFNIDDYDIYILPKNKGPFHFSGGDNLPFTTKEVAHKNFAHVFQLDSGDVADIFIRVHSKQKISMLGVVRDSTYFVYYSNKEYFLLSIFYGLVVTASLSFFFTYLHLKEASYIYLSLYCFSLALLHLCNDGLGFQYLWGQCPDWNDYAKDTGMLLVMISLLLYTRSFLSLNKFNQPLANIFIILIVMRIILTLFDLQLPTITLSTPVDIVLLSVVFFTGVYSYFIYQYKPARYFVLAFTCLFIGYVYNKAMINGYIPRSIFGFYSFNWGSIGQIILFTLSLADRMSYLNNQVMDARNELIIQLKEKEMLKDKMNKELEEKVKERTKELEYKNQQLDLFIYKASHDIKGPLKSILGLARLGKVDITDEKALEYLRHVEKSTLRLDFLVHDLLEISKLKQARVSLQKIDFEEMVNEIKDSLQHLEGFDQFDIQIKVKQNQDFFQDRMMVYSIFQNIIENSFKYRDVKKEKSFIHIKIDINNKRTVIDFNDNGIGIEPDLVDRVFDMFFQANDLFQGSGLGLYLVRLAVEKIGGKIKVDSVLSEGTHFHLVI
ncbi:MAG: sensor histidine kinase [Cytophagaceae bacterium]